MKLEWTHIISASLGYIIVLILKTLIDFSIGPYLVKHFSWIPIRTFLRKKYYNISGHRNQVWNFPETEETFQQQLERSSLAEIKQLGNYIYAEFSSAGVNYAAFGRIKGNEYVTGEWYDINDSLGYFGSFEIRIIDKNSMQGKWMGHSKRSNKINGDDWLWNKVNS